MDPRKISIEDYNYPLPDDRIAQYPLAERHLSKLLVYKAGTIAEHTFIDLPAQLPEGTLLVFNNTRVVEARLLFYKPSGGLIEIFALEPADEYTNISAAMSATGSVDYKCLVGGANKWKPGMVLQRVMPSAQGELLLKASMIGKGSDYFLIRFEWQPADISFAEVLHMAGEMPIPPYLHRKAEASDVERYQTVYAMKDGSVAAPTAGLHFTPQVMEALNEKGVRQAFVTLHVGAGTFMPVKSEQMDGHQMHAEFIEADIPFLETIAAAPLVIPVGTTSMRSLESLYWMGVKAHHDPHITMADIEMKQWEVYTELSNTRVSVPQAMEALVQWLKQQGMQRLVVRTSILIAPGYPFKICKGIVTNFHQPKSTLLLLVAALIGDDWRRVYDYALSHEFRFLSYGDSSLLLPG